MFLKLKYPEKLIDSIFKRFHPSQDQNQNGIEPVESPVRIILPFKDQKSANSVRRKLSDLEKKIDRVLHLFHFFTPAILFNVFGDIKIRKKS